MPFARPTLQEIVDRIVSDIQSRITGATTLLRRSILRVLARVYAGAVHLVYGFLEFMKDQIFVQSADAEYLEKQTEALKKGVETQKAIDEYALEQKRVIKDKELDIADNAIKLASGLLGKSKGVQKAALIAESAVGIGKTVQGVFTGNAAALAQGITQAGPIAGPALATPAIVLNSVQGALSVAGNVAATAKALQALGGGNFNLNSVW